MKLLRVVRSENPEKKYDAVFENNGRTKTISFGARGMSDYLHHKDESRREAYLRRHAANEDWTVPDTAGSLSRWLLWGPTTSLEKNLMLFRRRFNV